MDFIEFKKAYRNISRDINELNNKKYNTAAISEAKNKIENNKQIAKKAKKIVEEYNDKQDEARKKGQLKEYIENGRKLANKARTIMDSVKKDNNDLEQHIKELENQDKKDKEEDKNTRGERGIRLNYIRTNAKQQYESELENIKGSKKEIENEKSDRMNDLNKTFEQRKKALQEQESMADKLKEESLDALKIWMDEETGKINREFERKLTPINKQLVELEKNYKDLVECFDKMDKNPEIEGKEIGLPEEKKAPEEQKPVEEPVTEEPVVEEPTVEEPVAEEPVAEEPVVEEPAVEEPVVEEPVVDEPEKAQQAEMTDDQLIDECKKLYSNQPVSEKAPISEKDATYKFIKQIDIEAKGIYGVDYTWGTKEGQKGNNHLSIRKMGLLKSIRDRVKLLLNRDKYGIDFRMALRADLNVMNTFKIMSKEDAENYTEQYLNALNGEGALPCVINYHNHNNKYFAALDAGQVKFANKQNEEKEESLDERFGEGFDQHENPPTADDRTADEPTTGEHEQSVDEMDQDL